MTESADSGRIKLRWEHVALVLILLCAIFFRFYLLGEVPPGFNHDEAAGALDAQDALAGDIRAFYPREEGESTLWVYWLALLFALLGQHVWVVRAASAAVGVATAASVYWLTFELFRQEDEKLARRLALLSALWFSLSLWHVKLSRVGWPAITMPLFSTLFFAALWWAMRKGRTALFVLSGVLLGLSLYTTQPTRFIPPLLVAFFLAQWVLARRGEGEKPLLRRYFVWLVIVAGIALLFFVPLLAYNVRLPGAYSDRVNEIALWNPAIHQGDPWGLLWRSVRDTVAAFGLTIHWPANGNWFLDPLTAFFFVVGLLVALWRVRKPPYLFCLLWWPIMLLPTILAPVDAVPSPTRAVGALPVTYIFPAIGLMFMGQALNFAATLLGWGEHVSRYRPVVAPFLVLAAFLYPAYSTYHEYFNVFVHSELAHDLYHVYAVELARDMERVEVANAVFILPQVTGRSNSPDNTIAFLYRGVAPYVWLEDDETRLAQELTRACRGKNVAFLVNWKASKHIDADPRGLIPFLLEKYGEPVALEAHDDYDIVIFQLLTDAPIDFSEALELKPTKLLFGGLLALDGYRFSARGDATEIPSGDTAWGVLRWRAISPMEKDYKASIILEDRLGHHVSQVDRLLLGNLPERGTSRWRRGETHVDHYRLSVPPAIPPDDYQLKVIVYDAESEQRLTPSNAEAGQAALLGTLPITRSTYTLRPEELPIEYPRTALISDNLQLLGIDGPASPEMRPGDQATLAFYWQAPDVISQDYSAILKLYSPGGEFAAGPLTPLGGASYPTSAWKPQEIVRSWYDSKVPADIPGGTYEWILEVTPQPDGEDATAIQLSLVTIEGLPRVFEVPAIQNPLTVSFDYRVALLGYDLETGRRGQKGTFYIEPGRALRLRLVWQTQNLMDESYTVFVHLLGPDGQIWGQQDRIPGGGDYPTTAWVKGEVVEDVFEIVPAAEAPAGDYQLAVGLYRVRTGERLTMYNAKTGAVGDMALLPARLILER